MPQNESVRQDGQLWRSRLVYQQWRVPRHIVDGRLSTWIVSCVIVYKSATILLVGSTGIVPVLLLRDIQRQRILRVNGVYSTRRT